MYYSMLLLNIFYSDSVTYTYKNNTFSLQKAINNIICYFKRSFSAVTSFCFLCVSSLKHAFIKNQLPITMNAKQFFTITNSSSKIC